MSVLNDTDKLKILEKFLYNIDDLSGIEKETNKLNIFNILKLTGQEIRHSNFLGWLLNPKENHGMGDYFLKSFLRSLIKNSKEEIDIFDLEKYSLEECEILREWKNIDLLIKNDKDKFICVIENKIYSKEHSGQTRNYKNIINSEFSDYKKIFVYLTISGEEAEDTKYIQFTHEKIHDLLKGVLESKSKQMNSSAINYINNYLDILNMKVVENSKIKLKCQDIYRKYKKALDLIYEHKPDRELEINQICQKILGEFESKYYLEMDIHNKKFIRFIPECMDTLPETCKIWTSSKRHLLFERTLNNDLEVRLVLSDVMDDHDLLEFSKILTSNKIFKKINENKPKNFLTIYTKKIMTKGYKERDDDKLEKEIREGLNIFFESSDYEKIVNLFKDTYREVFKSVCFVKIYPSKDKQGNIDFSEIELQNKNEEIIKTLDMDIGPEEMDEDALKEEVLAYIESQDYSCEELNIVNIEICD